MKIYFLKAGYSDENSVEPGTSMQFIAFQKERPTYVYTCRDMHLCTNVHAHVYTYTLNFYKWRKRLL